MADHEIPYTSQIFKFIYILLLIKKRFSATGPIGGINENPTEDTHKINSKSFRRCDKRQLLLQSSQHLRIDSMQKYPALIAKRLTTPFKQKSHLYSLLCTNVYLLNLSICVDGYYNVCDFSGVDCGIFGRKIRVVNYSSSTVVEFLYTIVEGIVHCLLSIIQSIDILIVVVSTSSCMRMNVLLVTQGTTICHKGLATFRFLLLLREKCNNALANNVSSIADYPFNFMFDMPLKSNGVTTHHLWTQ
ncbi:hypothetical protein FF38_01942 [Lucilia cuprina]|uniref:Uncharacterized protein n=1 Tax=Lucilia cuprina TaxID=7375 RepID=A0A0L0CQU9_LUCCU|nr:hypothetical protein FF38_01942 [Lucilia cuprina]